MSAQGNSKILGLAVTGLIIINVVLLCFMFFKKQGPPAHLPDHENGLEQGPHGERPPDKLIRDLGFNENQQTAFLKLKADHRKSVEELLNRNRKIREDLFSKLSMQDSISAIGFADSIASTQKEIELLTFSHFKEVRKICNEKQKEKFDLIIGDVLRTMGGRPGPPQR